MTFLPLTYRCNQKCVFCSAPDSELKRGLAEWIKEARKIKGKLIQISGGEPLTADTVELLAFLKVCAGEGRTIEFQTNATLIPELDEKIFLKLVGLVELSGGYFNVNYPAHEKSVDFPVTKLRGGFEKRLAGVKRLLSAGAHVRLTHVLCRKNFRFVPAFVRHAKKLGGISWIQFSFVKAAGRAEENKKVVPRYEEAAPYLNSALRLASKLGIGCEVDHIPVCFIPGFAKLHVDCKKISSGAEGPFVKEKKKIPACRNCRFSGECAGPRLDYLKIYGGFKP